MLKLGRICWNSNITPETQYGNIIVYDFKYKSYGSQEELDNHYPDGYQEWWQIIESPTLDDYKSALDSANLMTENAKIIVAKRQDNSFENVKPTPEFMKTPLRFYKLNQDIHECQKGILEQEIAKFS